ncbi:hypothetical protein [Deinococcus pimensis]|uniref:hypothetical protein n=1 Tax=Deinococcus pimensis TaxID=309888 RepID=UPI0004B8FC7F|nr:hypothetical protein [Deinococcus pimensis]
MPPVTLVALILLAISWSRVLRRGRSPSPALIVFSVLFAMIALSTQAWVVPLAVVFGIVMAVTHGRGSRPALEGGRVRVRRARRRAHMLELEETARSFHSDLRQFMRDIDELGREVREEARVAIPREGARPESVPAAPRVDLRKKDRERRAEPVPTPAPQPQAPTDELTAAVDAVLREHGRDLPPEAVERVRTLRARVAEAAGYLRERDLMNAEHGFHLKQIATDYLPGAVRAYLRLPRGLADTEVLSDGKTGKDLLLEQLDLLAEGTSSVLSGVLRAEAQQLLAHGRFLEKRFETGSKDFDV